jgi:AraC-like DNA-binding protein
MVRELFNEFAEQWFHASSEIEKKTGIQLMRAGRNLAKPNYSVGPKVIPHYGLHFVLHGKVFFSQGTDQVTAKKGDVFCVFPNHQYSYSIVEPDGELRLCWLTLQGDNIGSVLQQIGIARSCHHLSNVMSSSVEETLEEILDNLRVPVAVDSGLHLISRLFHLFHLLHSEVNVGTSQQEELKWLQRSLDFIHANFRDNLQVNDAAAHVGISRAHFSRTFTRIVKQTPHRYIQLLRLRDANYMLFNSSLSIKEIAASLGYDDPYTFTRAYKKLYGKPPSARYRPFKT